MEQTRTNKKTIAIVAAVACLALAAALGTYAWLTSTGKLTNNFTTAGINQPTTDPDNPNKPIPTDEKKVNGNLTETKWENNSKLAPGTSVPKNPNVGLGKGSENAYVFVAVTNRTASATAPTDNTHTTYFTLENGWLPVPMSQDSDGAQSPISVTVDTNTHYIGGLFMYVGGDNAQAVNPVALAADANKDVWTGELFKQVTTPATTASSDFAASPSIDVNYYISAADDQNGDYGTAEKALEAAKAWYKGINAAA